MGTPPIQPHNSYVYFARCGQYVKIGKAGDPQHRVKRLFNGHLLVCPADLDESQPVELLRASQPRGESSHDHTVH